VKILQARMLAFIAHACAVQPVHQIQGGFNLHQAVYLFVRLLLMATTEVVLLCDIVQVLVVHTQIVTGCE
jgi:hypothetical protein